MEGVSASHGVLGPLLGKLTGLLAGECSRLKGVRREIRSLKAELTSMHAAVHKYTLLQDPDVQVKAWISLLRELTYDIKDVIDKFIYQLGNDGQHQGGFKEFFRKTVRRLKTLGSRRGIANKIDDLKIRLKEVKDLKSSYKLDPLSIQPWIPACLLFLLRKHSLWELMVQEMTLSSGCWKMKIARPSIARCCPLLALVGWEKQHWPRRSTARSRGNFIIVMLLSQSRKNQM
uniref:Disease resistance N-terminal domain-containing protein n=1 Tax=Aegilops tauschii subsp. strangulata TaxID=200361 RepID=A0A453Q217_AEGTS